MLADKIVMVMGIFSFIFSVLISILVVFVTFKLFSRLARSSGLDDIKQGNAAMAIAVVGDLIAFGILMARCLYPVSAVLQNLFVHSAISASSIAKTLGYISSYVVIAYVLSIITVLVSSKLFQKMTTSLDEIPLIKENNVAVAILLSGVVITVAVMVQNGLADALNTLIPQVGMGPIDVR